MVCARSCAERQRRGTRKRTTRPHTHTAESHLLSVASHRALLAPLPPCAGTNIQTGEEVAIKLVRVCWPQLGKHACGRLGARGGRPSSMPRPLSTTASSYLRPSTVS